MGTNGNGSLLLPVIGGVVGFGMLLIVGSYGYTWDETKELRTEAQQWRKDHLEKLDKEFGEVRIGQRKLEEAVHDSSKHVESMLERILEEQKKVARELQDKKR